MTSSMLAAQPTQAANEADPADQRGNPVQRDHSEPSASFRLSNTITKADPRSTLRAAVAATGTTIAAECTTPSTTGLVSSLTSQQEPAQFYTVHQQPPLRSQLHSNTSSTTTRIHQEVQNIQNSRNLTEMQQAADYFRPYLHNTYPVGAVGAAHHNMTAAASGPTVNAPTPMYPVVPPTGVSGVSASSPYSRIGDSAAAMAAAEAVRAAAAAVAANNNSPTYKGYQDFYANNNLELSNSVTTPTTVNESDNNQVSSVSTNSSGSSTSQQYPNQSQRMFPARPQPTRPVMLGGPNASPKPKIESMQPPPLSPSTNASSLTPPPSVVTHHHRSQNNTITPQQTQKVQSTPSSLGSSAALYRDKLGLNSPNNNNSTTPPTITPASPATTDGGGSQSGAGGQSRRPSGNNNPKYRYPSGPSSNSSPPPPATPSSAMSSREGTPLPPSQRQEDGSAPPNVDISRVQIAEGDIKRENSQSSSDVNMTPVSQPSSVSNSSVAGQNGSGSAGPSSGHSLGQGQQQFYSPATSTSSPPFSAQYPYLAQHQQQHHHMAAASAWPQPHNYYSSPLDGTNNNLMAVRSLQDGLRTQSSLMGGYNYDHQGAAAASAYQYGTIHHYSDHTAQQMGSTTAGVGRHSTASTVAAAAAAVGVGRGRGHHHSGGSGNGVKIGRRPAHLPKVLKFQDKTLPPGWVRKLKCRKHGKQAGRWDVYIYSPCGVKFASKKKLKAFFEKNNLNYDIEEFDFTPYGRHTDSSSSRTSNATNATRHNSSGSTGSEGTHTGGSPASLHNYSPTHHHALHSSLSAAAAASASASTSSASSYMPPSMMTANSYVSANSGVAVGVSSAGQSASGTGQNSDFPSFPAFDPLMENPPNASVTDVPPSSTSSGGPGAGADFSSVASNLVAASNLSVAGSSSEFFPAEMAEILGQPTVTSTLANGLTGSAFGPPHGLASDYSDLNRSLHQASSHLHPLSNLSMESRASTEEESEEMNSRDKVSSSGISKAFRALNDFGNVYSNYD